MKPKVYAQAGEVNHELVSGSCEENMVVEMLNAVRLFGYFVIGLFCYWVISYWGARKIIRHSFVHSPTLRSGQAWQKAFEFNSVYFRAKNIHSRDASFLSISISKIISYSASVKNHLSFCGLHLCCCHRSS